MRLHRNSWSAASYPAAVSRHIRPEFVVPGVAHKASERALHTYQSSAYRPSVFRHLDTHPELMVPGVTHKASTRVAHTHRSSTYDPPVSHHANSHPELVLPGCLQTRTRELALTYSVPLSRGPVPAKPEGVFLLNCELAKSLPGFVRYLTPFNSLNRFCVNSNLEPQAKETRSRSTPK